MKALLGVLAERRGVSDADIDAYIAAYRGAGRRRGRGPRPGRPTSSPRSTASAFATRGAAPAEGVPVLFLHGFGGDLDNWLFNLDALAERHPVIALDLPGHGESDAKLPGTGAGGPGRVRRNSS